MTSADEAATSCFRLPEEQVPLSSVLVVSAVASSLFVASIMLVPSQGLILAQLPSSAVALAIVVMAVQMAVIVGLLLARWRRRRMELSFRESEEAMALAASSANIGLWRWDIASDKVRATPHCRIILRLTGNEPCNLRTFLTVVHPDDRARFREAVDKAIESRQRFDVEHRIVWPNGETRWIAASGRAKYGKNGAVALTGVFVDITHRKEAEADADRHRNYVTHLTRVSMLGELSGAVAHELNQPLTAIMSNAQAAQRMLSRPSVDLIELKNTIRDIIDDDSRAGEVIRHLRSLLTKSDAKFEPLDLNKIVGDVLSLTRADLVIRQVRTVKHLTANPPLVIGDQVQLQQVFLNLIMNACDALMANDSDNRVLTVSTVRNDGSVEAVFADNGPGFSKETMDRLFEPFFTTKQHGIGLGLPISRSIVTAHRGEVWA
ncbi:MAG: sensor histidine kinase, partial [Gammaproteobacteria bacterium]